MSKSGIVIPYWSNVTKAELIEIARLVEELNYDSIWVPEMWGRDAFSLLTLLALNTKKVKLGTGIVSVFSRTPATIAQTIATLDEISEGRMILGLGTSGPIVIEDWHGMKFEKPLERIKEYVEIIRMILSGERVEYEGDIFKLKNFRLQFTPPRKDIPIYIASLGPKSIRLTGSIADGWIPFLVPREHIQRTKEGFIAEAKERGVNQITVCPYIPACISKEIELSKRVIREHIAYYVGGMGTFYYKAISQYGFSDEANLIAKAWKRGSKTQAIEGVSDRMLDAFAVFGNGDEGRKRLERFKLAGADLCILIFPPKTTRDTVKETIFELAPKD